MRSRRVINVVSARAEGEAGDMPAIVRELSGRGWITCIHQHMLDPDHPWPGRYRLNDTRGVG